jgi:3-hydroxyisobutyrate dehydrogenase-like beta-hydroxyacid dehydrogenase
VLGCAIEALGEGFALTRTYGVKRRTHSTACLTDGLFGCWAYKTYGKFIADERYLPPGQSARNGLKDANLALAAGEAKSACRCLREMSGATGWSAPSPTAKATTTGR